MTKWYVNGPRLSLYDQGAAAADGVVASLRMAMQDHH